MVCVYSTFLMPPEKNPRKSNQRSTTPLRPIHLLGKTSSRKRRQNYWNQVSFLVISLSSSPISFLRNFKCPSAERLSSKKIRTCLSISVKFHLRTLPVVFIKWQVWLVTMPFKSNIASSEYRIFVKTLGSSSHLISTSQNSERRSGLRIVLLCRGRTCKTTRMCTRNLVNTFWVPGTYAEVSVSLPIDFSLFFFLESMDAGPLHKDGFWYHYIVDIVYYNIYLCILHFLTDPAEKSGRRGSLLIASLRPIHLVEKTSSRKRRIATPQCTGA